MITFAGNPINILGPATEKGTKAQDFIAVKQDLSTFRLSDLPKDKVKVISVAPSIDTGICSLQTIFFNQEAAKYKDDVELVEITVDLPFAQKRYCAAEGIDNLTVVSDYQTHDFGMKYGFLIEGLKLLTRGVVIIDKNDTIQYVEYVKEVTTEPNYDAALEVMKTLI
ncbi:MAG: thiol peroxidase [Clostridiales bacterium]|nr:thiol peroxidase [Clostridiales bacterium]